MSLQRQYLNLFLNNMSNQVIWLPSGKKKVWGSLVMKRRFGKNCGLICIETDKMSNQRPLMR